MKLFLIVLVLAGALGSAACHPPASIQTPAGAHAYTADQIVKRLGEFQQATIDASDASKIPVATARTIVQWTTSAIQTLKTAPIGWGATARASWIPIKAQVNQLGAIASWTPIVDALLEGQ